MLAISTTTRWYEPATRDDEPTVEQLAAVEQRVGVPVEFDRSGWLAGAIEVRVACNRLECVLVPKSIRVSRASPVDALIDQGGIVARCQRYNEVIRALRVLLCNFDEAATRLRPAPDSSPDFHASHAALQTVQLTALERLDQTMGVGVISLRALDGEIEYFSRCYRFYERVLAQIQLGSLSRNAPTDHESWDEETLDPWDEETLDRAHDSMIAGSLRDERGE